MSPPATARTSRPAAAVRLAGAMCLTAAALAAGRPPAQPRSDFPAAWAGRWEGTLELWSPGASAPSRRVRAEHIIAPVPGSPGVWRWRTVYDGDSTRGLKDYRLRVVDAAAGAYATDEGNGILLPARLVGGALVTVFAVGRQQFATREALRGDTLDFELVYWDAAPADTTRGAGPQGEGGTPVLGYRVRGIQRATYVRRSR